MLVHPDNLFASAVQQHREVLRRPARFRTHGAREHAEGSKSTGSRAQCRSARLSPART